MSKFIEAVDRLDISGTRSDLAVNPDKSPPQAIVAFEPLSVIAEYAGPIITASVKRRESISHDDCIEIVKGKKFIDGRESPLRDVPVAVWDTDANCIYTKRDVKVFLVSIRKISAGDELHSLARESRTVNRMVSCNMSLPLINSWSVFRVDTSSLCSGLPWLRRR